MEDVDQRALASVPGISIVLETFRRWCHLYGF
jgi:hypothetical protein